MTFRAILFTCALLQEDSVLKLVMQRIHLLRYSATASKSGIYGNDTKLEDLISSHRIVSCNTFGIIA